MGKDAVGYSNLMPIGTLGWLVFVALCVAAYMICRGFEKTILPDNALVALIASAPVPAAVDLITARFGSGGSRDN